MAFRPKPKNYYGQVVKYVRYIKQFPKANSILPGRMYAYFYMFDKDQDFNLIKFWDLMPLTFMYENYKTKDGVKMSRGLNLHHAPVRPRQIWLSRAKKIVNENDFQDNTRLIMLAKWRRLYLMMMKFSKKSVRQYNIKNMRQVRQIPNDMIEETLKFYARTWYGINIGRVEKDYLIFRI